MGSVGRFAGWLAAAALALAATEARAHGIAGQGRTLVSIERITGASYDRYELDAEDTDQTTTSEWFAVGLLGVDAQGLGLIPRTAVDYFMSDRVTAGLGAVYLMRTGRTTVDFNNGAPSESRDNPRLQTLLVNPRFGYAIPTGYRSAIWTRVGGTWVGEWEKTEQRRVHLNLVELSIDALWATKIADFLTLSAGPFLDLGLLGQYDTHESGAVRTEYTTATSAGVVLSMSALVYGS